MRLSVAAAFGLLMSSVVAHAQAPLGDDVYMVAGKSLPAEAMASWTDKAGKVSSAMGAVAAKAPKGAVKYSAKSAPWPTGRIRVMTFSKATGGVLHPITDETLLYVMSGSAQVEVSGKPVMLAQGDVVSRPSGALRNIKDASDAVIVTWTVPSLTGEATPIHVLGANTKEGGAGTLKIKRYEFPGNSVRAVTMAAGSGTTKNSAKTDSLMVVTAGRMKFHQADKVFEVVPGDFIREIAGLEHFWEVIDESGFVTTSGLPVGAAAIDPTKATDVPPAK
jgi:quercetin dioxygenase-like cupin family protein